MPVKRKRGPTRKNRKETKRAILISQLVPSELFLDRESVEKAKSAFESGNAVRPIVVRIGRLFYVLDGNHRVKAAQELGKKHVECRVRDFKKKRNVADLDEDTLKTALKSGFVGFKKLPSGTKSEKEALYKEEDELILDF